jgi:amino acid adenylation domain-containing protein
MSTIQAEGLSKTLSRAIAAITAGPRSSVRSLDLTTDEEKQKLWTWNREVPAVVERCVHDLFAEQAAARPEASAICAWDGELTYAELDALSTRLASHLLSLGVKPDDVVPLCFEKSMWTVVAMLAVLKAGGAFVPLDPEHPASRREEILKQTKAVVVLTSPQFSTLWEDSACNVVSVNKVSINQLPSSVNHGHIAVKPSNIAYVIFTSGSTGQPKGVVLEHRAVSTSCLEHGKAFGFTAQTRALQFAAYTFDACIVEIVTTLLYGGCVCVPSKSSRRDGLGHAVNNMDVNCAVLTPSVARLLEPSEVSCLKLLVLAGEQVTSADWGRWAGQAHLINGYGPAECCVCCTVYADAAEARDFASGVIGKSVASVGWVVDPANHNRLAPLGSIGELLVEGPILARGYLNDAEKTSAAFINDPTWLTEGIESHPGRRGRLYKTGDLVRYNSGGNLVCVGRKDGQVKVRGQRVELGEIEHHVRECMPEAKQVAVEVVLPGGKKEKTVVAAFLQLVDETHGEALPGEAADDVPLARVVFPAQASAKLADRLPGYMMPDVYFAIAQLPMTVSGKTDRKRLREIGASFSAQQLAEMRTASEGPKRVPSTEAEKMMQRLWARVLNIEADSIGLDDSFFRLGGDSIAAMKLVAEARNEGFQLAATDVFRQPKLKHLARSLAVRVSVIAHPAQPFSLLSSAIKEAMFSDVEPFGAAVRVQNAEDIAPVTYTQQFFISQGLRSPLQAFNYLFVDLGSDLVVDLLRDSCRTVLNHFPILRTQFVLFQDNWWQLTLRNLELPFSTIEVEGSLAEESQNFCTQDLERVSQQGFQHGMLPTSFTLVRSLTGQHRLIIRLSHAQYDGVCLPVILNSLADAYWQKPLPPAPPYSAYLAYSQMHLSISASYWSAVLKGSRITNISSILRPQATNDTALRKVQAERFVDTPLLPGDITMASLVSTAWAVVLSHISGEDDVVYGHLVAGRNSDIPGITEMVGPCLNIIPVRTRMSSNMTSTELLQSVQEQHVSVGQSDSMGLDDIIQNCTDWPADSTFDTVVQHQNIDEHPETQLAGLTAKLQWFNNPNAVPPYLGVLSYSQRDRLRILVLGNTHILTPETADSLAAVLCKTIAKLSAGSPTLLALCKPSSPP